MVISVSVFRGKPTLVDWKTIYAGSCKSNLDSQLITDDLFSDPMQVAAYVGAVNADPRFSDLPSRVKQGALVCVFEDGREPQVVMIGEEELEVSSFILLLLLLQ